MTIYNKSCNFLGLINLNQLGSVTCTHPLFSGNQSNQDQRRRNPAIQPLKLRPALHVHVEPSLMMRLLPVVDDSPAALTASSGSFWESHLASGNLSAHEIINQSCQKLCWRPPQVDYHCCIRVCLLSFSPERCILSNVHQLNVKSRVDY